MRLAQILECNDTLGTCCNDYALVSLLDTVRKMLNLFQILIPIILIVMCSFQLIKMVINPEEKKLTKGLYNKFFAAVIVFFIPTILNAVLGMMPQTFSVTACWQQAKISAEVLRTLNNKYIPIYGEETTSPILIDSSLYEKGNPKSDSSGSGTSTGSGHGSAKGKSIVSYASQFVGKPYVWGGTWNGELPYTGTDCSGFVQGVFKHNGINLTRTTYTQWADKSSYTLVSGEIKAGDLVMYDGHVGMVMNSFMPKEEIME